MRFNVLTVALVGVYILALGALLGARPSQDLPPAPPNIFSGKVFIAGNPAPDGIEIFAMVDDYRTNVPRPGQTERLIVLAKGGKYGSPVQVIAQPPDGSYVGKTITFHATRGFEEIKAEETAVFKGGIQLRSNFDLNFPAAPPGQPTPTATPTITPTPTPTPILPISGDPSIPRLSRIVVIVGIAALVAGGAILLLMRRRRAF